MEFDGLAPARATFEVPLDLLNDGDNQIEVRGHASGLADQPSIFYINDFVLTYPRGYRAEDDALAFSSAGHGLVSVSGFASEAIHVWELSNTRRPKRVVRTSVDEHAGAYLVSFRAAKNPTPYITFTTNAVRVPEDVIADKSSDFKRRHHRVDCLIITAGDLVDAAELDAVTTELMAYEQSEGDWQQGVVMAADLPDLGGDLLRDSDRVAGLVPGGYQLERIHLDGMPADDARTRMLAAFSSGRAFVNFFGHSGFMGLGNTNLISAFDVTGLGNGERLPVVTAFTCLAGQFGFPGQESISETLVIDAGGGAAMSSPSGLSINNRARLLGEGFYSATFGDGELVIGEVILKAQAHYARDGVGKYLLDVYNLIGDPATIMK